MLTAAEASDRLSWALIKDEDGRYRFACRKALVTIKIYGARDRVRFCARDKVTFRIDPATLTVEQIDTGVIRSQYAWDQIECLAAGEPETDCRDLFQG